MVILAVLVPVDRLTGGNVVDMLYTGWWPTFNLADVFITVGCGLLLLTSRNWTAWPNGRDRSDRKIVRRRPSAT